MLRKKQLTIQTEFFEDTIQGIPNALLISPIYRSQDLQQQHFIKSGLNEDDDCFTAAQIIERLLTSKLIENFMNCWQTLKSNTLNQQPLIPRALSSVERISSHYSYIRYPEVEDPFKRSHQRMSSQGGEVHSSKIQWLQERKKNSHNMGLAGSYQERTRIIKQIVEKLRRGREEVQKLSYSLDRVGDNYYVHQQISRLEQVAHQLQIQRMHLQNDKINRTKLGYNLHSVDKISEQEEQNDLEVKLWSEVVQLRNQLKQLRLQSEQIHQRQLRKDRQKSQQKQQGKVQMRRVNNLQTEEPMRQQSKQSKTHHQREAFQSKLNYQPTHSISEQKEEVQSKLLAEKEQIKRQYQLRSQLQLQQLHKEIELLKQTQNTYHQYMQQTRTNQNLQPKNIPIVQQTPNKLLYSVDIQTDKLQTSQKLIKQKVSQEIQTSPQPNTTFQSLSCRTKLQIQQQSAGGWRGKQGERIHLNESNSPEKTTKSSNTNNFVKNTIQTVSPSQQNPHQNYNKSNQIPIKQIEQPNFTLNSLEKIQAKQTVNYLDRQSTGRSDTRTNDLSERKKQKNTLAKNIEQEIIINATQTEKSSNQHQRDDESNQQKETTQIRANSVEAYNLVASQLTQMLAAHKQLISELQTKSIEAEQRQNERFKQRYQQEIAELHQKIRAVEQQQQIMAQQHWHKAEDQLTHQHQQQIEEERQYQMIAQQQQRAIQTYLQYQSQLRQALSRQLQLKQQLLQQQTENQKILKEQINKEQSIRQNNFALSQTNQTIKMLQEQHQALLAATQNQLKSKDTLIQQMQSDLSRLQQQLQLTHFQPQSTHRHYTHQQQNINQSGLSKEQHQNNTIVLYKQQTRPFVGLTSISNHPSLTHQADFAQPRHYSIRQDHTQMPQAALNYQITSRVQQDNEQPRIQHSNYRQMVQFVHSTLPKIDTSQPLRTTQTYQAIRLQQSKVYPVSVQQTPLTLKPALTTQRTTYATAPINFSVPSLQKVAGKAEQSVYSKDFTQTKSKIIYWPRQEQNSQNCACCF